MILFRYFTFSAKEDKKVTLLIFYRSSVEKDSFVLFQTMPLHITKIS